MLARKASTEERARYPCASSQQRFWFEEQLHPGNPGLNIAVRWRLEGSLSSADLDEAWRVLIARHAALRTCFATEAGEAVQVVEPTIAFAIPVVDLTALAEADALREADRLAEFEAQKPFDLSVAPLVRVTRVQLRADAAMLLVTTHHTICDGWSIGILAREMGEVCAALHAGRTPALPQLPVSYGEFAAAEREWLAGANFEEETAYLERFLAGYKQFELMTDRPRPALQTSCGRIVSRLLERGVTDGLAGLARANGCTLFIAALAALYTLLHRYSGETDIALGTQVVGRDESDIEGVVGCFINTIALRGDLTGTPSFVELLERTRDTLMETLEFRRVPLERLIAIVKPNRDLSRNALFSVNFIFQRSFIKNEKYGSFALVDLPSRSAGALYDLNIFMVERPEGWRISCEYNTDLFEDGTVVALLGHFETLLRAIVAEPATPIATLAILSDAERRHLAIDANRTQAPYPADRTFPQLFAERAAAMPGALALVCGDVALTYAQLDAAANRLAHELRARGVRANARTGVFLERSADLVIALLAILKAGGAYVPLDPAYPPERLAFVVQNSGLSTLVTRTALAGAFAASGVACVLVDADADAIAARASAPPVTAPAPEDVAYVIYTSGSTGTPKGVQIQHRALVNFLCAMRERPGLDASDTLVAVTTISFDIAGLELYLPLLVGGKLVVATAAEAADGAALVRLLRRSDATVLQATPVTWHLLLDAGWHGDPQLKMLCGGEAVSRELATQLLDCGEDLWNMYGPTETTIWSAVARIGGGDGPVLVGPPIANTQFYVLDANREVLPSGAPGELYIGGESVALGYLDLPALTDERFVPDPFRATRGARLYRTGDLVRQRAGGYLEFLGRTDHQVKLRGFRIELGEIEAQMRRHPSVADAVAVVGDDAFGEKTLWAYVVPRFEMPENVDVWTAELRARLAEFLPAYMLPAPIVVLPALPRTPNGKIDRKMLPKPAGGASERRGDPARTPTESMLASAIANLLGLERVGRGDDVFALGFHSLLAVRLVARIRESLGIDVSLRDLFEHPSVATLAERIDASRDDAAPSAPSAPIVTLNAGGERRPLFYFHSDLFADGLYSRRLAASVGSHQPFHAVSPHGTAGLPLLPTIEAMALDYLPRVRAVQPAGPYRLGGFCVSGLVAYELARLLRAAGEAVEDVVMINASPLPSRSVAPFDWLVRTIGLEARLDPGLRESLCYNIARLHGSVASGPRSTLRFLRGAIGRLLARDRRDGRAHVEEPQPFEKRRGTTETENAFAHLVAALTFHPKPYDGPVTLIWGVDQALTSDDTTVGWRALAREVRVVPIPGGHVAALHEKIDGLARELDLVLVDGEMR